MIKRVAPYRIVVLTHGTGERFFQCLLRRAGDKQFYAAGFIKPTRGAAIADLMQHLPLDGVTLEEFNTLMVLRERSLLPLGKEALLEYY